ncbi:endospore germination permease [Pontibacillus sp. HMF3514]|uniref:GerAB/ArcD/ProY family transporter n=1 Tax=Pontibacillus sp. HMF3514 TaxID=2692425 RepID=UPI0013202337|nr:endospore germination permease [Pontibacillus sp. HMF3514]QHE52435.1 endospore germination permease [Pontibacillus sp. HMF3514]
MEKAQISSTQFVFLIIMFEFGSTIVVGMGFEARQDAWLVILLGMVGGVILYLIYTQLHKKFPNAHITTYSSHLLGKYLGYIVAWAYIFYFFYLSARVLRDFSELMVITILKETPLLVVILIFTVVIVYSCTLGIETVARTSEIFFPYVLAAGLLFLLFVFVTGIPQAENLQPPLEKGWGEILMKTFPESLTFPFGELVVFTMLFPYLNREEKAKKLGIQAILISTLVLIMTNLTIIASLGPDLAQRSVVPLLDTVSLVNIQGIVQRIDPIVIIMMVIVGVMKIVIFFLAAYIGLHDVIPKLKNKKRYVTSSVLGVLLMIVALMMSQSYVEHIFVGLKIVPPYVHVPMQIIIPTLLLLLSFMRGRKKED